MELTFEQWINIIELVATIIGILVAIFTLRDFVKKDKEKLEMIGHLGSQADSQKQMILQLSNQTLELKKHSDSFSEHNKILENQFKLSTKPVIRYSHTLLKKDAEGPNEKYFLTFVFKNGGGDATNLFYELKKSEVFEQQLDDFHDIGNIPTITDFYSGRTFRFSMNYYHRYNYEANVEIIFSFMDNQNNHYSQKCVFSPVWNARPEFYPPIETV